MKFHLSSSQHIGSRGQQQDSFAILDSKEESFRRHAGTLVLVADGMGGLAFGELASRVAAARFVECYREKTADESIPDALLRCTTESNAAVYKAAEEKGAARDMGTTLVAGVFHDNHFYWNSVGDSGIFHLAKGEMHQLNRFHTLAVFLEQQAEKGVIPWQVARSHPEREALTAFLGMETLGQVDRNEAPHPFEKGDVFLLASDGMFKVLDDSAVIQAVRGDASQFASRLTSKTINLRLPHQDNVTVVSVCCGVPALRSTGWLSSLAVLGSAVFAGWAMRSRARKTDSPRSEESESGPGESK